MSDFLPDLCGRLPGAYNEGEGGGFDRSIMTPRRESVLSALLSALHHIPPLSMPPILASPLAGMLESMITKFEQKV